MDSGTDTAGKPIGQQLDAIESALANAGEAMSHGTATTGYGYAVPGEQPTLYSSPATPSSVPLALAQSPASSTGSVPLPKRPKGRLLAIIVCVVLACFAGNAVWNSFLRYAAYGEVVAQTIEVSPPWNGIVKTLHVREGDDVLQGQLIVTTESLELNQRLEKLGDELKLSQARLEAEIAEWKLRVELRTDRDKQARAQFYEMWGELLRERSKLHEMQASLRRAESLIASDAISDEELESIRFSEAGQRAKVDKMKTAVTELHGRIEWEDDRDEPTTPDALKPQLARIESLQEDLQRLRTRAHQGRIHSPVSGRVVRVVRYPGEYADVSGPIVELLVEGSTEVVVYLEQRDAELLGPGQPFAVDVQPARTPIACTVVRIGDQLVPAPPHLEVFYSKNTLLLPVYARPSPHHGHDEMLRVGSTVRLPRGPLLEHVQAALPGGASDGNDDLAEPSARTFVEGEM